MSDGESVELMLVAVTRLLERLAALPPSPEVSDLRQRAVNCERVLERWAAAPPPFEDREKMAKLLLWLHTKVGKLDDPAGA